MNAPLLSQPILRGSLSALLFNACSYNYRTFPLLERLVYHNRLNRNSMGYYLVLVLSGARGSPYRQRGGAKSYRKRRWACAPAQEQKHTQRNDWMERVARGFFP